MLLCCSFAVSASRLSDSIASTISFLLLVELAHQPLDLREHRLRGVLPALEGRLSSLAIVFSWATPPPLSTRLSAPKTSSTSGLRPVCSSGMSSPSPSARPRALVRRRFRDTNFSPRRLVCRISATAFSGRSVVLRSSSVTSAVVPLSSISVDLADVHVVDLDRVLGTRSRTSRELHGDRHRVVAHVGAAGERQLVDVEVAAAQHAVPSRIADQGAQLAGHGVTPTRRAWGRRRWIPAGGERRGAVLARRSGEQAEDVAEVAVLVDGVGHGAQHRAWVRLQLVGDVADVGVGVQGAGVRVVGERQVVQRQRTVAKHLVERGPLLHQDLGHPVEALDVAAQGLAVLLDEAADLLERDAEVAAATRRAPRAHRRAAWTPRPATG